MASRRKTRKAKARKPKPPSEQRTLGYGLGCLNGPVLSVEMGTALFNWICFLFIWGFWTTESLPCDFFFYIMPLFSWLFHNPWLFSAISDQKQKLRITRYSCRKKQVSFIDSIISALEPCLIQQETNSWTPVISCHVYYLIIHFYLDLTWLFSVQSKSFDHLVSGICLFFPLSIGNTVGLLIKYKRPFRIHMTLLCYVLVYHQYTKYCFPMFWNSCTPGLLCYTAQNLLYDCSKCWCIWKRCFQNKRWDWLKFCKSLSLMRLLSL